jgi:hypothetical protein
VTSSTVAKKKTKKQSLKATLAEVTKEMAKPRVAMSARDHSYILRNSKNPKQVLAVRCPTCGAVLGEGCELTTGQPRTEPHRDRRLIAAD